MKRRILALITTVVLCVGIVAGMTLAYLKDDDRKLNLFEVRDSSDEFDDSVEAVQVFLAEPSWSPDGQYQFRVRGQDASGNGLWVPNTAAVEPAQFGWGYNAAKDFLPGARILKDPTVQSIGYEPTFVGAIVSVANVDGNTFNTLGNVERYFDIQWNVGNNVGQWSLVRETNARKYFVYNGDRADGSIQSVYNKKVKPWAMITEARTQPLFDYVTVNRGLTGDELDKADKFELVIDAYGVQAVNDTWQDDPNYVSGRSWGAQTAFKIEFGTEWSAVNYN